MRAWPSRLSLIATAVTIACGCANVPSRTFFNDLEGGDSSSSGGESGGGDDMSSVTPDSTGFADQSTDTGALADGQPGAGPDVREAGQPPLDATLDVGMVTGAEGGADSTVEVGPRDGATGPDASADVGVDAVGPDSEVEAAPEGGTDSGPETDCGVPDTLKNCGACGVACGSMNVSSGGAKCVGGACAYMCSTGYSNCNQSAPNTTGCECPTPGCCMSGCETTHTTAVQNIPYFDCNALAGVGTPQATLINQALAACQAYMAAIGGPASACSQGFMCQRGSNLGPYVCNGSGVGNPCNHCWSYGGVDVLEARNCTCGGMTYGPWN